MGLGFRAVVRDGCLCTLQMRASDRPGPCRIPVSEDTRNPKPHRP